MRKIVSGLVVVGFVLSSMSCVTTDNAGQGALVGAAGGAIVGSLIGDSTGDAILGAIIGAAIGGAAGAYIGSYMDRQAAEMRQGVEGAEVERLGEGIRVTFDIGLFFEGGGFELLTAGRESLAGMAVILNRYPDTHVFIEGPAYVPGRYEPDVALSERRARVMADFLNSRNVRADRFTARGYSRTESRGRSDPTGGRLRNKRVGLAIMANDNLKRTARTQVR
ncbi:MAG: glycine zipper domain-containing protein [Candidatus Aminicenantales bacterium]|jgi:outer membrane protein OmpA-like peptidoglycan-associated protein